MPSSPFDAPRLLQNRVEDPLPRFRLGVVGGGDDGGVVETEEDWPPDSALPSQELEPEGDADGFSLVRVVSGQWSKVVTELTLQFPILHEDCCRSCLTLQPRPIRIYLYPRRRGRIILLRLSSSFCDERVERPFVPWGSARRSNDLDLVWVKVEDVEEEVEGRSVPLYEAAGCTPYYLE
ncbi:hypothetical protein PLICRDRAFT_56656 [Plicaturopsis crispa FD-325 SS-3]|nr:hypothetical protein PLICRDRAFT_56656 [Plicaturopsis crispa FD-325 SS-3]